MSAADARDAAADARDAAADARDATRGRRRCSCSVTEEDGRFTATDFFTVGARELNSKFQETGFKKPHFCEIKQLESDPWSSYA